jgi:hypothetical protein
MFCIFVGRLNGKAYQVFQGKLVVAFGMHEIVKASVVLLAVAVLVAGCSAQITNSWKIGSYGVVKRLPWLHVEGQWIVDEYGNRVQLRGAGMDYTSYMGFNGRFEQYVATMKQKGCNVMRLAFSHPQHRYGTTTVYDPDLMDYVLNYLEQNGLYAILDFHHYGEWEEQDWRQDWINLWVQIATRYKDNPVVVGYELCNEPYSIDFPEPAIECLNAIRQVDTKHIIFLAERAKWWWEWAEGEVYSGRRWWIPAGEPGYGTIIPSDSNIVFDVHHWVGSLTHGAADDQPTYYCEASEYVYFLRFLREKLNRPVWAGEFGAYDQEPGSYDMNHVRNIMALCEDAGIMWTAWMMEMNLDWNYLIPTPYTTKIVPADVPRPFKPLPFNMLEYVIGWNRREIGYNRWGSSFYDLEWGGTVTIKGPCQVKMVKWDDFYGDIINGEEIINVTSQVTIGPKNWSELTYIFAYAIPSA